MFNDFASLSHTLIVVSPAYLIVIVLLRLSGKRTLSKWNAYDFVVTVAYGSILATLILSQETSLLQGLLGLGILLLLQFVLDQLTNRFNLVQRWINAQPTLLLLKGEFKSEALSKERVTEAEIRAAVRAKGIISLKLIEAVVLETDGSFSVIQVQNNNNAPPPSAMSDVDGFSDGHYPE
ncbi:MAG: DUF421 domain-containing protein [Leptolyngbyaceae cyanobacterium]